MEGINRWISGNFEHEKMEQAVGRLVVGCARLETALDNFIWRFAKCCPKLVKPICKEIRCLNGEELRGGPPRTTEQKMRFVIGSVFWTTPFRKVPIYSGDLDATYQSLFWSVMELQDVRNHLVHGAIDNLEVDDSEGYWRLSGEKEDFPRRKNGVYRRSRARFTVSSILVERLINAGKIARRHVENLQLSLDDPDWVEREIEAQKEIEANWVFFAENVDAFEPQSRQRLKEMLGAREAQ